LMEILIDRISGQNDIAHRICLDKQAVNCLNVLSNMRRKDCFNDALEFVQKQNIKAFGNIPSGKRYGENSTKSENSQGFN
jgi:hypothetical protein